MQMGYLKSYIKDEKCEPNYTSEHKLGVVCEEDTMMVSPCNQGQRRNGKRNQKCLLQFIRCINLVIPRTILPP